MFMEITVTFGQHTVSEHTAKVALFTVQLKIITVIPSCIKPFRYRRRGYSKSSLSAIAGYSKMILSLMCATIPVVDGHTCRQSSMSYIHSVFFKRFVVAHSGIYMCVFSRSAVNVRCGM
jgi:hypothetical protein